MVNGARTVVVIILGAMDNYFRGQEHKKKIPMNNLALLSFGGLRGAIAVRLTHNENSFASAH